MDIDPARFDVDDYQQSEEQRESDADDTADGASGDVEPDRRGDGEQDGRRDRRIRATECIQQRDQQQATTGRAEQVAEVDPVDALNGLRNHERNNRAGTEKRQSAAEINERKLSV